MSGALTIRVTATDTAGATATQDFTVTVNNTNDGPVASAVIADQSTNEDAGFSFTVPPASFTDVDVGDTLTLSATSCRWQPAARLAQLRSGNADISPARPSTTMSARLTIRVTATDTAGATATQDFHVTVNNTNDGPVASAVIADQSTNEDAGFSFTVAASQLYRCGCGRHAHPVGDTCRWQPAAGLAQHSIRQPRRFSGTPLNDDVGALTIRVTATDTAGATATQDFTVTVNNTNDGPVASAVHRRPVHQ